MFKEDIKRTIGKVLKENGHKIIPLCKHTIFYIKRYSDKLGFYVRCVDNRHYDGSGGIIIQIFFTAIQVPDDRIVTGCPELEILVLATEGEITDELIIGAGNKVIAIENNIGGMASMVLADLESPYLPSERSQRVREILTFYDTVSKDWKDEFEVLRDKVNQALKKKQSGGFQLCCEFIDSLPADYFQGKLSTMDLNTMKNEFSEQLRAQFIFGV